MAASEDFCLESWRKFFENAPIFRLLKHVMNMPWEPSAHSWLKHLLDSALSSGWCKFYYSFLTSPHCLYFNLSDRLIFPQFAYSEGSVHKVFPKAGCHRPLASAADSVVWKGSLHTMIKNNHAFFQGTLPFIQKSVLLHSWTFEAPTEKKDQKKREREKHLG